MILLPIAAFLAGSIPFGLVVSRLFFGSDLRSSGSGNIGAANALRSLGAKGGAAVLVLDMLKGFVPTFIAAAIDPQQPWMTAAVAFLTVAGHCFSPWLRLKGGKGVATFVGALFALSWPAGLVFAAVWAAVFRLWGFASLSSLAATAIAPCALYLFGSGTQFVFAAALSAIIIIAKHRANIERLRAGTESKLSVAGRKSAGPPPASSAQS